jgi:hypothetical protein
MALRATKPDDDAVRQMWGQALSPAAELPLGVLGAKPRSQESRPHGPAGHRKR